MRNENLIALRAALLAATFLSIFFFACEPACVNGDCSDDDACSGAGCGDDDATPQPETVELAISVTPDSGDVSVFVDDVLKGTAPASVTVTKGDDHFVEVVDNAGLWYYTYFDGTNLSEDAAVELKGGADLTGTWIDVDDLDTEHATMEVRDRNDEPAVRATQIGPIGGFYVDGRALSGTTIDGDTLNGMVSQDGNTLNFSVTWAWNETIDYEYHKQ